jgi:hypothetical protein
VTKPQQLELFTDGARSVAAHKRPPRPRPTEADLQARLDAARQRLHEIVILRMKTWVPDNPQTAPYAGLYLRTMEAAARALAVAIETMQVQSDADIEAAMTAFALQPGGGVVAIPDSFTRQRRNL